MNSNYLFHLFLKKVTIWNFLLIRRNGNTIWNDARSAKFRDVAFRCMFIFVFNSHQQNDLYEMWKTRNVRGWFVSASRKSLRCVRFNLEKKNVRNVQFILLKFLMQSYVGWFLRCYFVVLLLPEYLFRNNLIPCN